MISWQAHTGPFRISVWEEASSPTGASQDASLVAERPGGLRVAAIDGVSPHRSRGRAGADDAAWAAAVTRAALGGPLGLRDALHAANGELHEGLADQRAEAQACVVAADVGPRGIHVMRGGDCEAWVQRAGIWRPLLVGDYLVASARQAMMDWQQVNGDADVDALVAEESRALADPALWISTPLGRAPSPKLQEAVVPRDWHALCLASDGACLTTDSLRDLPGWMARVREHEAAARAGCIKARDDITVVLLERVGPLT